MEKTVHFSTSDFHIFLWNMDMFKSGSHGVTLKIQAIHFSKEISQISEYIITWMNDTIIPSGFFCVCYLPHR